MAGMQALQYEARMTDRILAPEARGEDADVSLRPQTLSEFIGQAQARANLKVFIEAAKARGEALDHVLFAGPPGLGKTTLAQIVARELGVNFRATSGPVIARAGDLAALLTNLEERDILFIDEIHRLNPAVEEILYPAMEDFQLDLIIGEGPAARSVRIDMPPFTLIGATTRSGLITRPLRERFGIPLRLVFYEPAELDVARPRGEAHRFPLRVYYEDTDAAGIVYYANYLRFAERARTELVRSLGFEQERLRREAGFAFAVRRCAAEYLAPARLDDELIVASRLVAVGGATLEVEQRIRRDDEMLVRLDVKLACLAASGRPV